MGEVKNAWINVNPGPVLNKRRIFCVVELT
jgi:hypothetical protein